MPDKAPSFYDKDFAKYRAKFQKSIDKRREYKQTVAQVFKSLEGGDLKHGIENTDD